MAWSRGSSRAAVAALAVVVITAAGGCGVTDETASTTTTKQTATTTTRPAPTTTEASGLPSIPHRPAPGKSAPEQGLVVAGVDLSGLDLPEGDFATGWRRVTDDRGVLTVVVADTWKEDDTAPGSLDGIEVPSVFVAADLEEFEDHYDEPGVKFLLYGSDLAADGQEAVLEARRGYADLAGQCSAKDEFDYDDGIYQGIAELWTGCASAGAAYLLVVASPEVADADFELVLEVQMLTQADVDVAIEAIQSFLFTGSAEDIPGPTTTAAPTTAPPATAPPTTPAVADADRAAELVKAHLRSCGMGWDWTSAKEMGSGSFEVDVMIVPPGPGSENGDPGVGVYLADTGTGEITSLNGTANVLCPG